MNSIEKYFGKTLIPQGLQAQVLPLFDEGKEDHKEVLARFREFLELLLNHLSVLSGITVREVSARIEKLASLGVIEHQVVPYFHFWWGVSCLGSHYQPEKVPTISWGSHLDLCRRATAICIAWYTRKYPALELEEEMRRVWLDDASAIMSVPYGQIELCCSDNIRNTLEKNNVVVLHGRPWVGKTSIATYYVTSLCNQGFVPLVIHETSLITFRILSTQPDEESPKSLRLNCNSQEIHEVVSSRLLHGDSFVVLLDDPFGHRGFQRHNPLMYLRIFEWLDLASCPHCLGSLRVLVTTPTSFLKEGRASLLDNGKTNPTAKGNLRLLDESNWVLLDVPNYESTQLQSIIRTVAKNHACNWADMLDYCDIVADTLRRECLSFDALHVLCRDLKQASEDKFLDAVCELAASASVQQEIAQADSAEQTQLCAAYVGEALIELYRDFGFQTPLSFKHICQTADIDLSVYFGETSESLSEWLLTDRVSTQNLSHFPVYAHPEVRAAVGVLAETKMAPTIHQILVNLGGISNNYPGIALARWEATHLVCRLACFLDESDVRFVNTEFFQRAQARGGDPRNVLWAIIGNWHFIRGTLLEKCALGFIKTLPNNFKSLIRNYIWEAVQNWTLICNELRLQVLLLTSTGTGISELRPNFDDRNTLTFMAAGASHYGAIQECARYGCEISEKYLDFMNIFVNQIARDTKRGFFPSRRGDGLFDSPGSQFSAKEVLQKLLDLGFRSGSFSDSHPFASHVKSFQI
jgi:hypothetical protein